MSGFTRSRSDGSQYMDCPTAVQDSDRREATLQRGNPTAVPGQVNEGCKLGPAAEFRTKSAPGHLHGSHAVSHHSSRDGSPKTNNRDDEDVPAVKSTTSAYIGSIFATASARKGRRAEYKDLRFLTAPSLTGKLETVLMSETSGGEVFSFAIESECRHMRDFVWGHDALKVMMDSIARPDGDMDDALLTEGFSMEILSRFLAGCCLYETERQTGNTGADYSIRFKGQRIKISVTKVYPLLVEDSERGSPRTPLSPSLRGRWPPIPQYFTKDWISCSQCGGAFSVRWFQIDNRAQRSRKEVDALEKRTCRSCSAIEVARRERYHSELKKERKRQRHIEKAGNTETLTDEEISDIFTRHQELLQHGKCSGDYSGATELELFFESRGFFISSDRIWFDWRDPHRRGSTVGPDCFARHMKDAPETLCRDCKNVRLPRVNWYTSIPPPRSCDACMLNRLKRRAEDIRREQKFRVEQERNPKFMLWNMAKLRGHLARKIEQLPVNKDDYEKQLLHIWVVDKTTQALVVRESRRLLQKELSDGEMVNALVLVTRLCVLEEVQQALFFSPWSESDGGKADGIGKMEGSSGKDQLN